MTSDAVQCSERLVRGPGALAERLLHADVGRDGFDVAIIDDLRGVVAPREKAWAASPPSAGSDQSP